MPLKKILLTGGLGYIGSNTALKLDRAGYEVVILDNLSKSEISRLEVLETLLTNPFRFYPYDIKDTDLVTKVLKEEQIDAVIHLAALKNVNESIKEPDKYYDNNVLGLISLLRAMHQADVDRLVFSSSASVYGKSSIMPITEEEPLKRVLNPYGQTKVINEKILEVLAQEHVNWSIIALRYFNPAGAGENGKLGESKQYPSGSLFSEIEAVVSGKREALDIYGNDYDTIDGTGVRDYIHIDDLAEAHLKALENLTLGFKAYNIGRGEANSVLEIKDTYEAVTGEEIPINIKPRRPGDIDICYCDASLANRELDWKAKKGLKEICEDSFIYSKE